MLCNKAVCRSEVLGAVLDRQKHRYAEHTSVLCSKRCFPSVSFLFLV